MATPRGMALKERLAAHSRPGPNGCIDFIGYRNSRGYGKIRIGGRKGRTVLASRASYEAHKGPIPPGKRVRHTCDRPPCINPEHLVLGTQADNVRDMCSRGRSGRILSAEAVKRIKVDTRLQREIAEEHGVSQVMISRIKLGKVWTHVDAAA